MNQIITDPPLLYTQEIANGDDEQQKNPFKFVEIANNKLLSVSSQFA